jgi:hypothetical protein
MRKLVSRTLLPALAAILLWRAIFFPHPRPVLAQNDGVQATEVTAKRYAIVVVSPFLNFWHKLPVRTHSNAAIAVASGIEG